MPLIVITISNGNTERSFVLKPRDGRVDQRIIQLCQQINELGSEERINTGERALNSGSPPQLPFYRILTPDQNWNLPDNLQSICLCEFVGEEILGQHKNGRITGQQETLSRGAKITEKTTIDSFINGRLRQLNQDSATIREKVRAFRLLTSVFKRLRVYDQHNGNYRFDPNSPCPTIPIDMEVISNQTHDGTDICTEHPALPLTQGEQDLVDQTRAAIFAPGQNGDQPFRVRHILIDTANFMGMLENPSPNRLVTLIVNTIRKKQQFNQDIIGLLTEKIILDHLNYDIPIFTKVANQIFYGEPHNGIPLLLNNQ